MRHTDQAAAHSAALDLISAQKLVLPEPEAVVGVFMEFGFRDRPTFAQYLQINKRGGAFQAALAAEVGPYHAKKLYRAIIGGLPHAK